MTSDATTFDPARLDEMTAQEFASFVGSMSDAQIQSTLGGEHRSAVLDWLFGGVPEHFRPERADGGSARIHFRITGGASPIRRMRSSSRTVTARVRRTRASSPAPRSCSA